MAQARSIPIAFPRAATSLAARAPLPLPPTRILGRDDDLRRIVDLLDRDDLRLVTLLGPGGVGKTRLSLEVARQVAPDFADGAVFVPLDAVRDPAGIPDAVARALGLHDETGSPVDELLHDYLTDRHLLLLLDNFEQVVAGAVWVAALLADHPRLRVLVTSRTPLHVGGEHLVHIAALSVTASGDEAARGAAVDLFVERARSVRPDFDPSDAELATVAEICRRLDGLPLAIELAAARVQLLGPDALLERLNDRLAVLSGGRRDVPVRLRSMRDAIGWSYDLLGDVERLAFQRLSAFVGGFSVDALAFVVAWPDSPLADGEALALLQGLVDQSLVHPDYDGAGDRFRMLETIREYGLSVAEQGDDAAAHRLAHAEYIIDLTRRAEPAMTGPEVPKWLDRLESDYPNLLAALDWLESRDRWEDAVGVMSRIGYFITARGHVLDSHDRFERWLTQPAFAQRGHTRGLMLKMWGANISEIGEPERARTALAEAVEMLQEAGDHWHESQAWTMLGSATAQLGDPDQARRYLELGLEAARAADNHRLISINLNNLAWSAAEAGDEARATELREEALAVARAGGDLFAQAFHLAASAGRALASGDLDTAERLANENLAMLESYRSMRELPGTWDLLAAIARARGDLDVAAERIATGLAIAERSGHLAKATDLRIVAGVIAAERGDAEGAIVALTTALRRLDVHQQSALVALSLEVLATVAARTGDEGQAARFHGASARALQDAGPVLDPELDADVARLRDALRARLGDAWLARAESAGAERPVETTVAEALAWTPSAPLAEDAELPTPSFDLSEREMEVLQLLANGSTNREIADELYVSMRTVATHVDHILTKLDVRSRTAAVAFAIRNGLA